jgi:hypothetical protein
MYSWLFDQGGVLLVGFFILLPVVLCAGKKGPHPKNKDGSCACGMCDGNGNRW